MLAVRGLLDEIVRLPRMQRGMEIDLSGMTSNGLPKERADGRSAAPAERLLWAIEQLPHFFDRLTNVAHHAAAVLPVCVQHVR